MNALQNCLTLLFCFIGIVLVSFPVTWLLRIAIRPAPWKPSRPYIHPTARVEGDAVIVSGDVENLQNQMHYLVSGGTWTKLKAGGWRYENCNADPHTIADAINYSSESL
jgi:hypothetical protein